MRILLAEDEPRVAGFIAKGLREQAYAVDVAPNGEEAFYLASVNQYDLLILDVMLPIEDGFTVCRKLRGNGLRIPILILTARDSVDDRVTGLDSAPTTTSPSPSTSKNSWHGSERWRGAPPKSVRHCCAPRI